VIFVAPVIENYLSVTIRAAFHGDIIYAGSDNMLTVSVYPPYRIFFRVDNRPVAMLEVRFGFERGKEVLSLGITDENGMLIIENWELAGRMIYLLVPENDYIGELLVPAYPSALSVTLEQKRPAMLWPIAALLILTLLLVLFLITRRRRKLVRVQFESGIAVRCEIRSDENPKTVEALMKSLPLESRAERWGKEVYFKVPFRVKPEREKDVVKLGDVAYWPEGPALCLFFGPTPTSPSPDVIKPYSPVNVIGRILGDSSVLERVKKGEKVRVERA
jgi:hypothetical protein